MITESIRERLYQELEKTCPIVKSGAGRGTGTVAAAPGEAMDLTVLWQREFLGLQETLLAQLMLQLHTLFDFQEEDREVRNTIRETLQRLFELEKACRSDGFFSAGDLGLYLFRRHWHEVASAHPENLLSGLSHLQKASFFKKVPVELGSWSKRFLLIERFHRLSAHEHEERLVRLRLLRSRFGSKAAPFLKSLEDLLVWFQFRTLEVNCSQNENVRSLSREIAADLDEGPLSSLFGSHSPQPTLFVLLKCFLFCSSTQANAADQQLLQRLGATRQMDSLLDLMRMVVSRARQEPDSPEASRLLDLLQADGFNIEHEGFRDPYEAHLVPLADTEEFECSRLSLFLPLDELTGAFDGDLAVSRRTLDDWHRQMVREVLDECEACAVVLRQPLPKADLFSKLVRFAASWTLARSPWPPKPAGDGFEREVGKLLPEDAVRQLVRPRKGYEVRSRRHLSQMIQGVVRPQWEALERIARSRTIQGFHDYRQLARYLICQHLQDRYGDRPVPELKGAASILRPSLLSEWIIKFTGKWGIDAGPVHRYTLDTVEEHVRSMVPAQTMIIELKRSFETSENELRRIYRGIIAEATPAFHLLLVAHARQRANLPRLPASAGKIPQLVNLLAPVSDQLKDIVTDILRQRHAVSGADHYRDHLRPYLLNASEWRAYLAWQVRKGIKNQLRHSTRSAPAPPFDMAHFLELGDLDALRNDVEQIARRIDLPPGGLGWETLLSTLLDLLRPPVVAAEVSEDRIQEVLGLLPNLDCGACGHPSCRSYSIALLTGRTVPDRCLHLSGPHLRALVEALPRLKGTEKSTIRGNPLESLMEHKLGQGSAEREAFQNALSLSTQQGRRYFLKRLKEVWDGLAHKPQIFKCPDPENIYRELCRYLGHEATERLREEERSFLAEHGQERQEAEWQLLKQNQNWLTLVQKGRQGRSLLQSGDGAGMAGEAYRKIFFLHQLAPSDRQLVLRFRLENYQDGFRHWWNDDLLTMNHPDFFIRDWEDFSRIIKNAYWHNEASFAAGDAVAALESQPFFVDYSNGMLTAILDHWITQEAASAESRKETLRRFRNTAINPVSCVAELRNLVHALIDEDETGRLHPTLNSTGTTGPQSAGRPSNLSAEDLVALARKRLWERFQSERFTFSRTFSCRWDELLPTEAKALQDQLHSANLFDEASAAGANTPTQRPSSSTQHYFLPNWDAPLRKRAALVTAMLTAGIKQQWREREEYTLLCQRDCSSIITPASVRLLVRQLLRSGENQEEIQRRLGELLNKHPDSRRELLHDALCPAFLEHQFKLLRRPHQHSVRPVKEDSLWAAFPELKSYFASLIERHAPRDREKLLHYLFILAKMEGNIETLTALLREIRETSDVIEAAWLRFTEELITEGPAPRNLPGSTMGIPLLVCRISEKDAVNRALRDGLSRREKHQIASAVKELLNFVRYHILVYLQQPPQDDPIAAVFGSLREAGYDLSGIDEEALRTAVAQEWSRHEQLPHQKIWIYTTATARYLAAQHAELQEVDREFHKIRLDLLKEGSSDNGHAQEIASRRGVALGQIKEDLYRRLSGLLEAERIATFQKRISQIVAQLDQKREEIHEGWLHGEINRRTIFYLLRHYQKRDEEATWEDFQWFLRDHWFAPLAELRSSQRPDGEDRIHDLDDKFRALLGLSLLDLEAESTATARHDFQRWEQAELQRLELCRQAS